jgi:uncharacterized protein
MASASVLPQWLAKAVQALAAGDIDGWMSMYAADAVQEFPWAPKDRVRRLEGRQAIAAHMSQLPEHVRFGPLDDVRVREIGDETIVQATGHHRLPDGTPSDHGHIWFITRRDSKVTHWQDYASPL